MDKDKLCQCPVCFCMVHPKKVTRNVRDGVLMRFVRDEYDCPKCGERNIYHGYTIHDKEGE